MQFMALAHPGDIGSVWPTMFLLCRKVLLPVDHVHGACYYRPIVRYLFGANSTDVFAPAELAPHREVRWASKLL